MKNYGTCKTFDVPGSGELALVDLTTGSLPLPGEVVLVNGEQRVVERIDFPVGVFAASSTGIGLLLRPKLTKS